MKRGFFAALGCMVFSAFFLSGCFKDSVLEKYSFYRPVYKTRAEVRASIKPMPARELTNPGKLFVKGNYIFLNEFNRGIHIIDYSNPASPKNIAFVNIPGNVDLAVNGNYLYADQYTDLVTLDISDPRNVQTVGFDERVFPQQFSSVDSNLVLADWIRVDTMIAHDSDFGMVKDGVFFSASVASSPAAGGSGGGKAGSMARFALMNSRLYTVSNHDLKVFDIANAADPVYVKRVFAGAGDIETIFPFKNNLFLGSMTGMHIFSVSNPDNPVRTGMFAHMRGCDPVVVDDNYAYVTLHSAAICGGALNQMEVIDVTNLSLPRLVKTYPFASPKGLSKEGDHIFLCDGAAGLKVLNALDPKNITTTQVIGGMDSYDVVTMNNTAIVSAKDGLFLLDYSDLSNVRVLSKIQKSN